MQSSVRRIFVEKKKGFDVEAQGLYNDLKHNVGIKGLTNVRVINRYDLEGVSDEEYSASRNTILSEPPVDVVYDEVYQIAEGQKVFAVEYLPGQYDQRADSASQCIQMLTRGERPVCKTAKLIVLEGDISDEEYNKIKDYCINPIETREAALDKPLTLETELDVPEDIKTIDGFITMSDDELMNLIESMSLAMSFEDLLFTREYFRDTEKRDPTITEIKIIDTYWSDHCRHTTFLTEIDDIKIGHSDDNYLKIFNVTSKADDESEGTNCNINLQSNFSQPIKKALEGYLKSRKFVYADVSVEKPISLMDIGTIAAKELKKKKILDNLDESDEINACSIVIKADVNGRVEEWLVMFKNETHNHPTEIEPFGGAATCLGGAIRDPLSGRSYVYQAMRITGSGDPRIPIEKTLPGKLPQRKITIDAAAGYSSYGNQVGLATGQVVEIYDENFVAKRMELGAVIGAAPKNNVVREKPAPDDVVILLGGRTGRDGCGGATGSSKEHSEESLTSCGAEVQKGNALTERNIQRLFRNSAVSTLIKKCNDFGAGGVAVAIGELADGLDINLDAVPKKYEGLDGTELAISESQERMAVVVSPENINKFIAAAKEENLEATPVAVVTETPEMKIRWRGKVIARLKREFLNSNGAKRKNSASITLPEPDKNFFRHISDHISNEIIKWDENREGKNQENDETGNKIDGQEYCYLQGKGNTPCDKTAYEKTANDKTINEKIINEKIIKSAWLNNLKRLNVCSQKGLVERFDSTIGAGTVLLPFGGKYQLTPSEGMVAKLPVLDGDTSTGTIMSFGYNPKLAKWSPFHGAVYAIIEAVAKIAAIGGDYKAIRLSLQEYFERLGKDPQKWGKPLAALLGAYYAQEKLGLAAIGGKDSMSGTFSYKNETGDIVEINVPPTVVAFAVSPVNVNYVVSSEFKMPGSTVVILPLSRDKNEMPDFQQLKDNYTRLHQLIKNGKIFASFTVKTGGIGEAISKMCFGNMLGFVFERPLTINDLFRPDYGSIVLEIPEYENPEELFAGLKYSILGRTQEKPEININNIAISLSEALKNWQEPLEKIFPTRVVTDETAALNNVDTANTSANTSVNTSGNISGNISENTTSANTDANAHNSNFIVFKKEDLNIKVDRMIIQEAVANRKKSDKGIKIARPRVFIPVFPGTNCEYDTKKAFEKAGAIVDIFVLRNLSSKDIEESIEIMASKINNSQIIVLPGGFSGGDEPAGSGKFIATAFRNPQIKDAVTSLLKERDGLMLGICNGFQALIKLGLVPYGEIRDMNDNSPTLTINTIGRHVSRMVNTKVASNLSPWLSNVKIGDIHTIAVSHGEGRFVASREDIELMQKNGQIATQYVDLEGNATYDIRYNPNGSIMAIEGITSPDGRVFGKMGHSERIGPNVAINVPGDKDQKLFEAGVNYFV